MPFAPTHTYTRSTSTPNHHTATMPTQKALLLPKVQADYVLDRAYPIPQPGKDEVLVKVKAAAINPGDYWVKNLENGPVKEFPIVSGFDIAGEVVKLGEGVTKFKVGDRV